MEKNEHQGNSIVKEAKERLSKPSYTVLKPTKKKASVQKDSKIRFSLMES